MYVYICTIPDNHTNNNDTHKDNNVDNNNIDIPNNDKHTTNNVMNHDHKYVCVYKCTSM